MTSLAFTFKGLEFQLSDTITTMNSRKGKYSIDNRNSKGYKCDFFLVSALKKITIKTTNNQNNDDCKH